MIVRRKRLLFRILLLISLLALCVIILEHNGRLYLDGCLKGTGEVCAEDAIQSECGDGACVTADGDPGAGSATSFHAKAVLILAYQRTGSTLVGRMFNSDQDNVFYLFEPLDAIYSAMYGTSMGWNVPSDISHHANGSIRTVPERELTAVSESMRSMLSCNVDRLPTQLLIGPFFSNFPAEFSILGQYVSCLDRFGLTEYKCRFSKKQIERFCGARFGQTSEETSNKCYQFIWNGKVLANVSRKIRQAFSTYRSCMKRLRVETDRECTGIIRDACTRRPVRVIKSVRATMDSVEPLLRQLPNFRVIHLIRDPRGVVVSRKNWHQSVRGRFSEGKKDQLVREAQMYCQGVVRDIRTRLRLEKSFPGRIYTVVYDDFVRDMVGNVGDIYRFLDMEVPNSTWTWASRAALGGNGRNATELAYAWQDVVSLKTNEEIVQRCRELFSLVGTKLPI